MLYRWMLWVFALAFVGLQADSGLGVENSPWAAYGEFLDFVKSMSNIIFLLTGCGMLMGSVVQYVQHRKNPANVRLSKPVTLVIMGLLLIGLAYIPLVISSGGEY